MGLEEREDSPQMMISALGMRGEVLMFHPSPNILVLVGTRGATPEIYARCP